MLIGINYVGRKHYDATNIGQWMWYFKKYTFVKGFNIRIFGLHFNVREDNATQKLIEIGRKQRMAQ